MAWFSKNFIALAASRRDGIKAGKYKKTRIKRGKTESRSERRVLNSMRKLGFKEQWKFGPGKYGTYRADFYHPFYKICVEIDGQSHESEEDKAKDEIRTQNLISDFGVAKVLRISNAEVWDQKLREKFLGSLRTMLVLLYRNLPHKSIPITTRTPNTIAMGLSPKDFGH